MIFVDFAQISEAYSAAGHSIFVQIYRNSYPIIEKTDPTKTA
jgi:hypothetical protein